MDSAVTSALRRNRSLSITALAVVVVLAWVYLLLGAQMDVRMMEMDGGQTMAMPSQWSLEYAAIVFIMWAVMTVAMMLPSAAKTILLTTKLDNQQTTLIAARGTGEFVVGYLAVWLAFGLAATGAQWALDEAGLLSAMAVSDNIWAGCLLIYAGIYQWNPLKQACLTHCRAPQDFLDRHWRRDGPLLTGLRHGLFCLGCCWMLMGLLFVGGLMNLACIAVIAVTILVEKTLPRSIGTSSLIGTCLIAGGAAELASLDFWRFSSALAQLI
jgi:predicted metal-binding membrane protein